MIYFFLKIVMFVGITEKTFAQNLKCPDVRLDQKGAPLSQMIETKQEMGTCYAHSAMMLYDHWKLTHMKPSESYDPSSVLSIAYLYKKNIARYKKNDPKNNKYISDYEGLNRENLDGGFVDHSLEFLKSNPPCVMKKSFAPGSQKTYYDEDETTIDFINEELQNLKSTVKNIKPKDSVGLKKEFRWVCSSTANQKISLEGQKKTFKEIVDIVNKNKTISFLEKSQFFKCKKINKNTPYKVNVVEKNYGQFDAVFTSKISNQLKNKSVPVAISFCSTPAYSTSEKGCGSHAAVIIGQRTDPKTKTCQFLVQDSGMDNSLNTKTAKHINQRSQKMWVDAKQLITHTMNAQYLSEP